LNDTLGYTVAALSDMVKDLAGDDESKRSTARALWAEMRLSADLTEHVDGARSAEFIAKLNAAMKKEDATVREETDVAMTLDDARSRILSACAYDEKMADEFIENMVRPRSSMGMVPGSVVYSLVSNIALSSVDTSPSPTHKPLEAIRDYDHVSITTAESSMEPMMERYKLAADFPGAGREPTGFESFDKEISLRPSTVTIVAGREGSGKSAFMLQAAASMSVRGPVVYVLTEMSQEDVWKRLTACYGHIEKWKLERPREDTLEAAKITHAWMAKHMSLYVVDAAGVPLQDYRDRRGHEQPGLVSIISDLSKSVGGVRAVFIDNLWGIAHANGELSKMSMSVALGSITKMLRECASGMMWDCPVILAHHLNREGAPSSIAKSKEQGGSSTPATENLGGSDQIGFDAEAVVLLSKESRDENRVYNEDAHSEGNFAVASGDWDVVNLHITKNRNGKPNTTIRTRFVGAQQRFEELEAQALTRPRTVAVSTDTSRDDEARLRRRAMAPL
jgi:replicative DNA helicase